MVTPWPDLKYWSCGEWQVVAERLQDIRNKGGIYCPGARNLFKALRLVDYESCRVMLVGQDPYPDPRIATGLAFSIPAIEKKFPPTLHNLFIEYQADLGYPLPGTGDLTPWLKQGVLAWNAIPSCEAFRSLSHDWPEWDLLTKEIVEKLSEKGCIFCFLGGVARRFTKYVGQDCDLIETSHPSPRASRSATHPFFGSRIFSTINAKLVEQGKEPINWRL